MVICAAHSLRRRTCFTDVIAVDVSINTAKVLIGVNVAHQPVFLPKQSDGYSFLGQHTMNLLVIDDGVRRRMVVMFAIKQLIKHLVGYIIDERPINVKLLSLFKHFADGVA